MYRLLLIIIISILVTGCQWVTDLPRSVWGSSNRVLSDLKKNSKPRSFSCDSNAAFDMVKEMTLPFGVDDREDNKYVLFSENRKRGYMILMDVPGAVDTTEVGVFFDRLGKNQTQVQVTSLSSRAVRVVEEQVFAALGSACGPAQ